MFKPEFRSCLIQRGGYLSLPGKNVETEYKCWSLLPLATWPSW